MFKSFLLVSFISILLFLFFSSNSDLVEAGGERFNTRIDSGLLALYTFQEGQTNTSITRSSITNGSSLILGDIILNLTTSQWIDDRIGIRFPDAAKGIAGTRARSQLNSAALLQAWTNTGALTIEVLSL